MKTLVLNNGYTIDIKFHNDAGFVFSYSQSSDIDTIIAQLTKDNLSSATYYIGNTLDDLITDKYMTGAHSDILTKEVTVTLGSAIDAEKAKLQAEVNSLKSLLWGVITEELPAIYNELDNINV